MKLVRTGADGELNGALLLQYDQLVSSEDLVLSCENILTATV
jgi:hypothetical protein